AVRVTGTDRDGHFEIAGLGADRLAGLELEGAALARDLILVVTRDGLDLRALNQALAESAGSRRSGAPAVVGPSFPHVGDPNGPLGGTVREGGSGRPVAGAAVQATGNTAVTAVVSDARGRFRIRGLKKAPEYPLHVTPPADAPLMARRVTVPDAPGRLEPI